MFTIGMLVICTITGVTHNHFMVKVEAEGKIRSVSKHNLLVDFSKYVKNHTTFQGDFSKKLVKQEDCIKNQ